MSRSITKLALAAAAALAAAGLGASAADAATRCTVDGGVLDVHMTTDEDAVSFSAAGGTIVVSGAQGGVICAGPTPTTSTIDAVLVVDDSDENATPEVRDGDTRVVIRDPADFAPGATAEADGSSEIEFYADTKDGDDSVSAASSGGPKAQSIVAGNGGLSWTADADADLRGMPFDFVFLGGGSGADVLSGRGGRGTGAPLSFASSFIALGYDGPDRLLGSDIPGGDDLQGNAGEDTLEGAAGDDVLRGGLGGDTVMGGPGRDTVTYDSNGNGVTVDLARTGVQDTGEGSDTLAELEGVVGTDHADRLAGTAGADQLDGGEGDDTLAGRGGADVLQGRIGTDVVSYADAPAGVTVDLARTAQPGGEQLVSIEDAIGSPFADTLSGNPDANRITGGGGADVIAAGDGDDRIELRDGDGDRAGCGAGNDAVVSDRRSLDAVEADCETVDALPEADPQPQTDGGRAPDTTLSFTLAGAKRQRLVRDGAIRVRMQSALEDSSVALSAAGRAGATKLRLRSRTIAVPAGPARTISLRLSRKQRRVLRTALAAGKRPRLTVTAEARDAAGNRVRQTLRVTAKR